MAGQVAEYIMPDEVAEWTELASVAFWFDGSSDFEDGKVYSIYNNSAVSFRFVVSSDLDEDTYGTFVPQGSVIYFRPNNGEKLYVQGSGFNLAISEIK